MSTPSKHIKTDDLAGFYLPRMRDIPDVGLMLEQTSRLVNSYLEPLGGIALTPSMISNYVKHDLIARPLKKLYYRQHIVDLIFIALAKTVLQLDDIRGILELVHEKRQDETYLQFCSDFDQALKASSETAGLAPSTLSTKSLPQSAEPADSEMLSLDEMLRQVAVTCVHQIRLVRYVRTTLSQVAHDAQIPSE